MQRIDAIVKLDRTGTLHSMTKELEYYESRRRPEVHVISLQQEIVRLLVMF